MNDKVNGFVLSIADYKEADVLMQVLTKEYGIISFVGKAAKRINSKNHFLPMCIYEFMFDYKDGKTIYSTHSSKIISNYFEDSDIDMMSFKNIFIEACLKNKEIDTYDQLTFVFEKLNKKNKYLLGAMFFTYLSKQFGITPVVDGCAICGEKKVIGISNYHGGFLCQKHLGGESILSVEKLKKFRMIIKSEFIHYDILNQFEYDFNDFKLVIDFFLTNADLKLKAYNFYEGLV